MAIGGSGSKTTHAQAAIKALTSTTALLRSSGLNILVTVSDLQLLKEADEEWEAVAQGQSMPEVLRFFDFRSLSFVAR